MSKIRKCLAILAITVSLFSLSSCFLFKEVKLGEVEELSVKELSLSKIQVELKVPIINKNFYKFGVTNLKANVLVDNTQLGEIKIDKPILIPAHSNQTQTFSISLGLSNLLNGLVGIVKALSANEVNVRVVGTMTAKWCIFKKTIQFNEEKRIKLKK